MTTPHFLDDFAVLTYGGGALPVLTADHMFGKILGLLFVQDTTSSQLVAFLHHTQQFYNRVNGVDNKDFTNKRAHNIEIVVVPSPSCDPTVLQKWMDDLSSPLLQISPDDCSLPSLYDSSKIAIEPALAPDEIGLVVVNWDGSVISRTGLVEVLTKGDSCLMSWQVREQI